MTELECLRQEVMQLKADRHPDQVRLLQQNGVLEQKDALLSEQSKTIERQEAKLAAQQLEINRLLHQMFGRCSERYLGDPRQMALDFGDTPEAQDAADGLQQAVDEADEQSEADMSASAGQRRRKKKKRSEGLPENLPRMETIVEPPEDEQVCATHGEKTLIGYDITETLVHSPATLEIHVTKYAKYACPNQPECGVVQAARPHSLVEGNRYDTSVAAQILTAKVWLSPAAVPTAGSVCRQRLDASSQHTAEHSDIRRHADSSAGRILR